MKRLLVTSGLLALALATIPAHGASAATVTIKNTTMWCTRFDVVGWRGAPLDPRGAGEVGPTHKLWAEQGESVHVTSDLFDKGVVVMAQNSFMFGCPTHLAGSFLFWRGHAISGRLHLTYRHEGEPTAQRHFTEP